MPEFVAGDRAFAIPTTRGIRAGAIGTVIYTDEAVLVEWDDSNSGPCWHQADELGKVKQMADSEVHHVKVTDSMAPNGTRYFQSVCTCGWYGFINSVAPGLSDVDRIIALDDARLRSGAMGGAHLKFPELDNSALARKYTVKE